MPLVPEVLPHQVIIASDLHSARQIEERLVRLAEQFGYSKECAFAVRLALEEAMVNAYKHGNRSNPDKKITVSYDVNPRRVVIRIRDEGPGFDPSLVPDPTTPDRLALPNGRGIMLMRAYLDEVAYNGPGNEVQLIKEKC